MAFAPIWLDREGMILSPALPPGTAETLRPARGRRRYTGDIMVIAVISVHLHFSIVPMMERAGI